MKVLCISDEKDELIYSLHVAQRYGSVDMIVSAGDLPLKYYEFIVSSLNKPFYFIFGNHYIEELSLFKKQKSLVDPVSMRFDRQRLSEGVGGDFIDGKVLRDRATGLLIGGLGGSMRYNKGEHQFTEFEMFFRILCMVPRLWWNRLRYGRYIDILVTHAPPKGIGDGEDRCHRGFRAFLWFMRHFKPRYLIHGHVHLFDSNAPRVTQYYETKVINVYSSYLLEDN